VQDIIIMTANHSQTVQSAQSEGYGETLGVKLLRELAGRGSFIFTIEEAKAAATDLAIPETYLPQLLSKLAASGWLLRLRRGLYAGMGRLSGEVEVHPFAVATNLVSPSTISHWSALHHHGLTEQFPRRVTASTTKKVVTPSMRAVSLQDRDVKERLAGRGAVRHSWEINGVEYEYYTITADRFFGIEEVWVDEHFRIPIYDRERSLLDCFAAPRHFESLSEALGILEEHASELDLEKLAQYALRYGKASVAKRLGWALDRLGAPRRVTGPLAKLPMEGVRTLDPTRPPVGRYNERWMVQENLRTGDKLQRQSGESENDCVRT
jgi:predicted transcriptional regulator of viral defense system